MASTSSVPEKIRVLSFNCWGLWYVAQHREQRLAAVADHLSTTDYDIIGLQEIWMRSDFERVRESVRSTLPEAKFWASGVVGSGLAIFSRWPIISTSIHAYALNGSPLDIAGGDYYSGKSIVSIVIDHPTLGEVEIFNTHMYARGGDAGEEWQRAHRLVGAWQFANLIRSAAYRGRYVIATGDFNSVPSSVAINIIRSHGGLTDAWAASHDSSLFPPSAIHTPQYAVHNYGVTADSPLNSYSAGKNLDETARRWQGKRLDYVFYRKPHIPSSSSHASGTHSPILHSHLSELFCSESKVVFTGPVPGLSISYSDHFGVEATLEIHPPKPAPPNDSDHHNRASSASGIVSSASSDKSGIQLHTYAADKLHLSRKMLTTTIDALAIARGHAVSRSSNQMIISGVFLLAGLGLVAGSAWIPDPRLNPVTTFFGVIAGGLATTLFYAGFIYGKYEVNMFDNAIEEIQHLKDQRTRHHRHSDSSS